ncbi:hypothetical protein HO173_006423 [Letharia columbiana]|uniref:Uncharacterized protein n=1 Tax=Letharia columbiana TaxID=112416 RepID=A0A8H6L4I7_9LECA|nr:uncharacterized protein HO173_006423 [Letharia columbiana]KAF6235229.1 hypothetical protein HO173_006423 [Letharia columbiana]
MTMAESMFEQAKMDDSRQSEQAKIDDSRQRELAKQDREDRRQQFELERQQRDLHHAAEMARSDVLINESKERVLRLQFEMRKHEEQQRGYDVFGSSNSG